MARYIMYIISFKISFSNDSQRVRNSRRSVIQYVFFLTLFFRFLKFLKPFKFHIFPINRFSTYRIFAIDMTGRMIRIYKVLMDINIESPNFITASDITFSRCCSRIVSIVIIISARSIFVSKQLAQKAGPRKYVSSSCKYVNVN